MTNGMSAQIRQQQLQTGGEGIGGMMSWQVWEDQFDQVRDIVDGMKPDQVRAGAKTYKDLSSDMDNTIRLFYRVADRMVDKWSGKDAQAALEQMNKAYRQAVELQTKANEVQHAMYSHASRQDSWKSTYGSGGATDSWVREVARWASIVQPVNPGMVASFIGNNWAAGEALQSINNGTVESNNQFPAEIRTDVPQFSDLNNFKPPGDNNTGTPKPPNTDMPGSGKPPSGDLPKTPDGMKPGDLPKPPDDMKPSGPPNTPQPPSGPGDYNPPKPGDYPGPGSGGSNLAGLPSGGGGTGLGGTPGGLPGGGGAGGGVPGGLGAGGGGLAGGPGGLPGGVPGGMGRGGPGSGGLGAAGRGGFGGMGMPMGAGGHGGGKGEERERTTWLTEDEDVWTGDQDAGPSVIG
ncbi:WXG100 family type VII secretion target [Thermomonospora amylolytica]|uniref:WXG100 family type VII secretion target n=1 Tax=Thermomonospora amylolytica TaxID=1411117 RepID=UPI000E6BFF27|nr:WXG100 family type VII secretion target [Thermomonospora amylolytica]